MEKGSLEQVGADWRLRYERTLPHPVEKVWRALTDEQELAAWFPSGFEGERRPGARLVFRHADQPNLPPFEGEMLRYEPPRLLELTWGGDRLRFELEPDGESTRLTFVVVLDELGKAARDGAGWHECLDLLEARLAGAPTRQPGTHWRELSAMYRDEFGPEASTLGPPEGWVEPS